MTLLKANFGCVKILRAAHHIGWFVFVPSIYLIQLDESNPNYNWLIALLVVKSIFLVADVVDVVSYAMGNHTPEAVGVDS